MCLFRINGMSALPLKADMSGAKSDIRFVPIADFAPAGCRSERVSVDLCTHKRVVHGPEPFLRLGPVSAARHRPPNLKMR